MPQMLFPVRCIAGSQFWGVVDYQKILGIPFLSRLGEVETAGDDSLSVNHHDLIVSDLVNGIDVGRHSLIGEESGR